MPLPALVLVDQFTRLKGAILLAAGLVLLFAIYSFGMRASSQTFAFPQNLSEGAATMLSDTSYPFNIKLVASGDNADKVDTGTLTSRALLAPHLGKRPVVLLFWMTTCGPCRLELSDMEARMATWQQAYDFAFVPVSLDFPQRLGAFHQRAAEYPWTSYFDVERAFPGVMPGGLNGVPQIFVYDAAGKLVHHKRKYHSGDLEALEAVLGRL